MKALRVAVLCPILAVLAPLAAAHAEEAAPPPVEGADLSDLESLLATEIPFGETGSFGYRLSSYGVRPYVHAYVTFGYLSREHEASTFDLQYFNLFVGANIMDKVIPEVQLEHEHGGAEIGLRAGQVDLNLHEALVIRVGKWLVPFGVYNEYENPEFISKIPRYPPMDIPLLYRNIIPVVWNDVGVQLRGRYGWGEERNVHWALYVSNGLEQKDTEPTDGIVDDGGGIRGMRGNNLDLNSSDKAWGGRVGVCPLPGLRAGVSGYTGAYTADGEQRLTMLGVDLAYRWRDLTLEGEGAIVDQETSGQDLRKLGFHVDAAYRVLDWMEPVVSYDQVALDGAPEQDKNLILFGLNFYPFPDTVPQVLVHTFYGAFDNRGNEVEDDVVILQASLGF